MKAIWQAGSAATRNGVFSGSIIAVVYLLGVFILVIGGRTLVHAWGKSNVTPLFLIDAIMLMAEIVLLFAAGFSTTRANGMPITSAAARSGLIAGLITWLAQFVAVVVVGTSALAARVNAPSGHPFFLYPLTNNFDAFTFLAMLTALAIHATAGAALGATGGIVGTPNVWREKDAKVR